MSLTERASSLALVGLAMALVMGCASPPVYINLLHPEYGKVDFDRDWSECQRENKQTAVLPRKCMAARGWSQITEPRKPEPSAGEALFGIGAILYEVFRGFAARSP